MISVIKRVMLAGSGAILFGIGGALLLAPRAFLEMSHIFIEQDFSLISELSAPGSVLLISGVFMLLGAQQQRFTELSLSIGAFVYGGYGIGRLISLVLHGPPSESLLAAMVIELAIAVVLIALRLNPSSAEQLRQS